MRGKRVSSVQFLPKVQVSEGLNRVNKLFTPSRGRVAWEWHRACGVINVLSICRKPQEAHGRL